MKYLTLEEVLFIHDQAVKRFGGSFGVRDIGLLESALARPLASFDGQDLYPSLFDKAAALIHSLLKNHPFVDGNKRTSFAVTGLFLQINGIKLINAHDDAIAFTMNVENNSINLEDISSWLKDHSNKV